MEFFYVVSPPRADCLKLGRWKGSVEKLLSRYKTPYGKFDACIFQYANSVQVERDAFACLAKYRWEGELFEKAALKETLAFAESACYDAVEAQDLLARIEVLRLRRKLRYRCASRKRYHPMRKRWLKLSWTK